VSRINSAKTFHLSIKLILQTSTYRPKACILCYGSEAHAYNSAFRYRNSKLEISTAPTKALSCRGNPLIHRRLSKTKSIGSGSDPESQAGRWSDSYGGCCLELRLETRRKLGGRRQRILQATVNKLGTIAVVIQTVFHFACSI